MTRLHKTVITFVLAVVQGASLSADDADLAASWSFDEPDEKAVSCMPNELAGFLHNVQRAEGVRGRAVCFSGVDNYVQVDRFACDFGAGWTIMFWVKAPPENAKERTILAFKARGEPGHLRVTITPQGFVRVAYNDNRPVGCGAVDDDRWHHVALTWNGTSLKFYLDDLDRGGPAYVFEDIPDGIQQVSGRLSAATGILRIGAMLDGSNPMRGMVDELAVFNGELTKERILDDFHAAAGSPGVTTSSLVPRDPLIVDPIWKSCKDGCLIFNPKEKNWWYFFMQIRPFSLKEDREEVADHYGTRIGVSVSGDGVNWKYRGALTGLDRHPDLNTFWAPCIFWDEETGKFHAFISYIQGVHRTFAGHAKTINHYTSDDLERWTFEKGYNFTEMNIDCTVHRLPNGKWGMWFKDEIHEQTGFAEGNDLYSFQYLGPVQATAPVSLEGAEVFCWRGYYWLTGDDCPTYAGCAVLRSGDGYHWTRVKNILNEDAGNGPYKKGHHPEVVVVDDNTAYIYYWCWNADCQKMPSYFYGVTNVRRLAFTGDELQVDRQNENFEMKELGEVDRWIGRDKHFRLPDGS